MTDSNVQPSPVSPERLAEALEKLGWNVVPPSQLLDDQLLANMERLAGQLQVIDGLTKRGAKLPDQYRFDTLDSVMRYASRIFGFLAAGEPVRNPWDREER